MPVFIIYRTNLIRFLIPQGFSNTWTTRVRLFLAANLGRWHASLLRMVHQTRFTGKRTHHIHMVEANFEHWDRILFRDYLFEHPEIAKEYSMLKMKLSDTYANDRVLYTKAKTDFIVRVTKIAKEYYRKAQPGWPRVVGSDRDKDIWDSEHPCPPYPINSRPPLRVRIFDMPGVHKVLDPTARRTLTGLQPVSTRRDSGSAPRLGFMKEWWKLEI